MLIQIKIILWITLNSKNSFQNTHVKRLTPKMKEIMLKITKDNRKSRRRRVSGNVWPKDASMRKISICIISQYKTIGFMRVLHRSIQALIFSKSWNYKPILADNRKCLIIALGCLGLHNRLSHAERFRVETKPRPCHVSIRRCSELRIRRRSG